MTKQAERPTARVWTQQPAPPDFTAWWKANQPDVPVPRVYAHPKGMSALVGREPVADGDLRWHISLSYADRLPDWDDLVDAAHALRPGVPFVIGIPPRSWWINVHRYTLHLYETVDPHLLAQWREERRGDAPS